MSAQQTSGSSGSESIGGESHGGGHTGSRGGGPIGGSDWRAIPSAPEWGRRSLSSRERKIAYAAVEAMLADGDHDAPSAPDAQWCEQVVDSYDLAVGNCSLQLRLAIPGLLRALNWLPAVVLKRPVAMTALPLAERIRYLDGLERHDWAPFTMLLIASKIPMVVPAFEEGDKLAMTGFDRPTTASRRKLPLADSAVSAPAESAGAGEPA